MTMLKNDALNYVIVVNQNKFEKCPEQAGNPAPCGNLNKTIILKPILNMIINLLPQV